MVGTMIKSSKAFNGIVYNLLSYKSRLYMNEQDVLTQEDIDTLTYDKLRAEAEDRDRSFAEEELTE